MIIINSKGSWCIYLDCVIVCVLNINILVQIIVRIVSGGNQTEELNEEIMYLVINIVS